MGDGIEDWQVTSAQAAWDPATEISSGTEREGAESRTLRSAPVWRFAAYKASEVGASWKVMPMTSQSLSATRRFVSTCAPAGSGTFVRIAAGTTSKVLADDGVENGVPLASAVPVGSGELDTVGAVGIPLGDVLADTVGGMLWRQ
jgi:hypothetical protein